MLIWRAALLDYVGAFLLQDVTILVFLRHILLNYSYKVLVSISLKKALTLLKCSVLAYYLCS